MSKAKKEFLGLTKVLQKISSRHQFANVFDDFMQMAICAFAMGRMEDVYLKIAGKYTAEELPIFGQGLAEMINEYENGMSDDGGWVDVLGTVSKITQPKKSEHLCRETLLTIDKIHPEIFKDNPKDDQGPSCSLAEALGKQDLFINTNLANAGLAILWKMFRELHIKNHGCYVNLETGVTNPIKIK